MKMVSMKRVFINLGYGPFAQPQNDEQAVANIIIYGAQKMSAPARAASTVYWNSRPLRSAIGLALAGGVLLGAAQYEKEYIQEGIRGAAEILREAPKISFDYENGFKPAAEKTIREMGRYWNLGREAFSVPAKKK